MPKGILGKKKRKKLKCVNEHEPSRAFYNEICLGFISVQG